MLCPQKSIFSFVGLGVFYFRRTMEYFICAAFSFFLCLQTSRFLALATERQDYDFVLCLKFKDVILHSFFTYNYRITFAIKCNRFIALCSALLNSSNIIRQIKSGLLSLMLKLCFAIFLKLARVPCTPMV